MTISFNAGEFREPGDRIRELVAGAGMRVMRTYHEQLDARCASLMAGGIAINRISVVSHSGCQECHGLGYQIEFDRSDPLRVQATLRECSLCPGLCVDGMSVGRSPDLST